ncbi:MAG: twin-arginine translocase subunit TatC [Chloroflexota bacterium]|nr:MAG: twin-arginine translocase subunit TatC [Chloroflexota bacterium]
MSQRITRPPASYKPPTPPVEDEDTIEEGHELRMGFFEHLDELRQRLFKAFLALIVGTGVGIAFAGHVLDYLIQPYGERLAALGPTEPVVAYFRVSLMIGGILAIPVITYQLLMFVLPGLTRREARILLMALPAITLLFVVGAAFAWFILVPPALGFLEGFQPTLFRPEWTADLYLGFITSLIFWMGVAFETPLIFFVLAMLGLVSPRTLAGNWRIAVVGSAIAAAVITPTVDPVNMFLVMAPLLALFLLSIFLVAIGNRINLGR